MRPARHPAPGQALAPPSLFDPAIWVVTPKPGPGAGTAFSVSGSGVWLTARHVVDGCARTVILTAPGRGVEAQARLLPGRETALLFTRGGAPALPLATGAALVRGEHVWLPGFPDGAPGEAAAELVRRARLVVGPSGFRAIPVLVFAETARSPALRGALTGLSGAPVLNAAGQVIGLTVAEAPRRRRLFATTPASLGEAMAAAGLAPAPGAAAAVDQAGWRREADALRARLTVAQVECLGS